MLLIFAIWLICLLLAFETLNTETKFCQRLIYTNVKERLEAKYFAEWYNSK